MIINPLNSKLFGAAGLQYSSPIGITHGLLSWDVPLALIVLCSDFIYRQKKTLALSLLTTDLVYPIHVVKKKKVLWVFQFNLVEHIPSINSGKELQLSTTTREGPKP